MGNPTMLDRVFHVIMQRMVETGEPHREDMVQRIGTKPQCYPLGRKVPYSRPRQTEFLLTNGSRHKPKAHPETKAISHLSSKKQKQQSCCDPDIVHTSVP